MGRGETEGRWMTGYTEITLGEAEIREGWVTEDKLTGTEGRKQGGGFKLFLWGKKTREDGEWNIYI